MYQKSFITKELASFRCKPLQYVKFECDNEFVRCHTINGKVRMKKSAGEAGKLVGNLKYEGFGDWIYINGIDDLIKLNADIDFRKLNCSITL